MFAQVLKQELEASKVRECRYFTTSFIHFSEHVVLFSKHEAHVNFDVTAGCQCVRFSILSEIIGVDRLNICFIFSSSRRELIGKDMSISEALKTW